MVTLQRRTIAPARANAVTWINPRRAMVARRSPGGFVTVDEIDRRLPLANEEQFLVCVALDLGPAKKVMVMGPIPDRVRFERVDVAIHHRPDRLVDEPGESLVAPTAEELDSLLEPIR